MEKYSDLYYKLIQEMEEIEAEASYQRDHQSNDYSANYQRSKAEGMLYVLNRLDRLINNK